MKKILCILCCIQASILLAQTETVLSSNGKKVIINTNPVRTANNGLSNLTPSTIQLGGDLNKPTTIAISADATLAITGLETGVSTTDNVILTDANGVLRTESQTLFKTEPWYVAGTNTQATSNTQNIYQTGKVGIGTVSPDAKLHLKSNTAGAIKIQDGTETKGAILTTDANGVATWKPNPISIPTTAKGYYNTTVYSFAGSYLRLGLNTNCIDLAPGSWIIFINQLIYYPNGSGYISCKIGLSGFNSYDPTFGGTVTYAANSGLSEYISYGTNQGDYGGNVTGTIVVTTTTAQRFYLWGLKETWGTRDTVFAESTHNYMFAVKVQL